MSVAAPFNSPSVTAPPQRQTWSVSIADKVTDACLKQLETNWKVNKHHNLTENTNKIVL